jgi:peptidoglycan-N-acetylglucosamine deacetylase
MAVRRCYRPGMADYVLTLSSVTLLSLLTLEIWQRLGGKSESAWRGRRRVAAAIALGIVMTGAATYALTKSRSFQVTGTLVRHVDTDQKVIALTFDDGPTPRHIEEVLGILKAHDATATFYLTGQACADNPVQARKIVEAGHELGNHTYSHRRMLFVSGATIADEIERTDELLRASGYHGPITVRPPGCKRLLTAPLYLARTGRTTVTWDMEPDSMADLAGDPDAMVESVVNGARPGSIVLMHVLIASREKSREALPRILEQLSAKGYRFVTVSELIRLGAK